MLFIRVNRADIKFVQADDALQVREQVADLLRPGTGSDGRSAAGMAEMKSAADCGGV